MNVILGIDRLAAATPWLVETSPLREDPMAIEEAIRGFFDDFNRMSYERCLEHVVSGGERDKARLIGLLRLARYYSGTIDIEAITSISTNDAGATATVHAMARGEALEEELKLIKTGTGWKLLWEAVVPADADDDCAPAGNGAGRANR